MRDDLCTTITKALAQDGAITTKRMLDAYHVIEALSSRSDLCAELWPELAQCLTNRTIDAALGLGGS